MRELSRQLGGSVAAISMVLNNQPGINAFRVYNESLGETAIRRIIDLIQNPDQPYQHIRIGTALKERSSVKQVK